MLKWSNSSSEPQLNTSSVQGNTEKTIQRLTQNQTYMKGLLILPIITIQLVAFQTDPLRQASEYLLISSISGKSMATECHLVPVGLMFAGILEGLLSLSQQMFL